MGSKALRLRYSARTKSGAAPCRGFHTCWSWSRPWENLAEKHWLRRSLSSLSSLCAARIKGSSSAPHSGIPSHMAPMSLLCSTRMEESSKSEMGGKKEVGRGRKEGGTTMTMIPVHRMILTGQGGPTGHQDKMAKMKDLPNLMSCAGTKKGTPTSVIPGIGAMIPRARQRTTEMKGHNPSRVAGRGTRAAPMSPQSPVAAVSVGGSEAGLPKGPTAVTETSSMRRGAVEPRVEASVKVWGTIATQVAIASRRGAIAGIPTTSPTAP